MVARRRPPAAPPGMLAHRPRRALAALAALALFAPTLAAPAPAAGQAAAAVAPPFRAAWARTELPVVEGRAARPYLWGPAPLATATERYDDAPGGTRLVQYFDKGRFTQPVGPATGPPAAGAADLPALQSGALVRDLVLGLAQVGADRVQLFDPAYLPVAGDDDPAANPAAPRYADFADETLQDLERAAGRLPPIAGAVGRPVTATVQAGARGERPADAEPRATIGAYDPTSGHNIAAPFWEAFAAAGLVVDPVTGADQEAPLYDWRLLAGPPLTEPAWTTINVGGRPTLVLVQLFARRALTYAPDGPAGWRVEMGNAGRHAHAWRHGPPPTAAPAVPAAPADPAGAARPLGRAPLTPATPRPAEAGSPPSEGAEVVPGTGPGGTDQAVLLPAFRTTDLILQRLDPWLTAPDGSVRPAINVPGAPVYLLEERHDGLAFGVDTRWLRPGVWALTVQDAGAPARRAVARFRVTAAPREVGLGAILDPTGRPPMGAIWALLGASEDG